MDEENNCESLTIVNESSLNEIQRATELMDENSPNIANITKLTCDVENDSDKFESSASGIDLKDESFTEVDVALNNSTVISSPDNLQIIDECDAISISDLSNTEKNEEENIVKRKGDEGFQERDELDFEEEKESGEEDSEGEVTDDKVCINKEEGEVSEEEDEDALSRQEPKTVCRFFNKGQCTWGSNCRFLHPGVSDKGNYNMFAASKPQNQPEKEENEAGKEKPRDVRPLAPEPAGFESAWERGLRHAKEMMKRANKRRETDADFEEKRFNLSLGQAELDRENDYYTRPASPVFKPTDEVIEYLDPYEKQAIKHFRGGHFENFEVRYKVGSYKRPVEIQAARSRREKFQREVSGNIPHGNYPADFEHAVDPAVKIIKEKRYPRPRDLKEERIDGVGRPIGVIKGPETWADPWVRRRTSDDKPLKKKSVRTRSYSSGSSSRSSRSSRSTSYSSYSGSRSRSRSSSKSHSSRSSSRSITPPPPFHPRAQQRGGIPHPGMRGGRGRGRGRGGYGHPNFPYAHPHYPYDHPPNMPPNPPFQPHMNFHGRPNMHQPEMYRKGGPHNFRDSRINPMMRHPIRPPPRELHERLTYPNKPNQRNPLNEQQARGPMPRMNPRVQPEPNDRVDMFGRTIRKEVPKSPVKSRSKSPVRVRGRRKFSLTPSDSGSSSGSGSDSRSRSRSYSRSHSGSSSSGSSVSRSPSPVRKKVDRNRKPVVQGTVIYGESAKSKAIDIAKATGHKQQIKMSLKNSSKQERVVVNVDDDSGESDTDARILKKRKIENAAVKSVPTVKAVKPRVPSPSAIASMTTGGVAAKKPTAARREELLKQLRAVEDAIARKRSKPLP